MNVETYLTLMNFPNEWEDWKMLPDQNWMSEMIQTYQPGDEQASEHDRNGAFHWWLRNKPTEQQLIQLVQLTFLDPDPIMAGDVRNRIKEAENYSEQVGAAIQKKK